MERLSKHLRSLIQEIVHHSVKTEHNEDSDKYVIYCTYVIDLQQFSEIMWDK